MNWQPNCSDIASRNELIFLTDFFDSPRSKLSRSITFDDRLLLSLIQAIIIHIVSSNAPSSEPNNGNKSCFFISGMKLNLLAPLVFFRMPFSKSNRIFSTTLVTAEFSSLAPFQKSRAVSYTHLTLPTICSV